jgi:hypothetical protein
MTARVGVTRRQLSEIVCRPLFPPRPNLITLDCQVRVRCPSVWFDVFRQQSIESIERISVAPLWMKVSRKAP